MTAPLWVEVLNKLAMPLIGAVSAIYVWLQYRRAKRWKAADLAAALLEKLKTEPTLVFTCHALDWGVGPLLIPEKYRPFFGQNAAGKYPDTMQHDTTVLARAMEPSLNQATYDNPGGLVYRLCFDELFSYLENVSNLLASGQIVDEDIGDLDYWLERIHEYGYPPAGVSGSQVFMPALEAWRYRGAVALARAAAKRI